VLLCGYEAGGVVEEVVVMMSGRGGGNDQNMFVRVEEDISFCHSCVKMFVGGGSCYLMYMYLSFSSLLVSGNTLVFF